MDEERIAAAEQAAFKIADKYAYQITDHIEDHVVQKKTFELVRESMITGIHLMQVELNKTLKKTTP